MSWTRQRLYPDWYRGRRNRTPKSVMWLRGCLWAALASCLFAFVVVGSTDNDQEEGLWMVGMMIWLGVVLANLAYGLFYWTSGLYDVVLGPDRQPVDQFVAEGGSYFWDRCMIWPINTDSERVRFGYPDPKRGYPEWYDSESHLGYPACPNCWAPYDPSHGCSVCGNRS